MSIIFEQKYAGTINQVSVLDEPGPGNGCHEYKIKIQSEDGNCTASRGIKFQKGPVKEVGLNGIQNEHLIAIVIHRLQGFQSGPYACHENAMTLQKLQEALMWAEFRTRDRVKRGVEGLNAS